MNCKTVLENIIKFNFFNVKISSIINKIWRRIEVVITGLTRNQFVAQAAREFESHRLRHEPVCGQCPQQALPFLLFSTLSFEGVFTTFVEIWGIQD